MLNKEKIIKGLKCCQYSSKTHCNECPYIYENLSCGTNYCTSDLASDVLDLLKNFDIIGRAIIKEPDCRICAQTHCKYYHESQKPTECRSYVRKEG